jgi:hypothetical protein
MGTSVKASCSCGYQAAFAIGGGMHSHGSHSYFPYYCAACGSGIVSVNIANETPTCPWNPNHKISRIGGSCSDRLKRQRTQQVHEKAQTMSLLERIGLRVPRQKPEQIEPETICQWDDHEILDQAYRCPMCQEATLRFNDTGRRFD